MVDFEWQIKNYLGLSAAVVSSGTQGLLFALQAMGVRPGQKVILPSFSFMATAQAVIYANAVPVFAEIGFDLTICPSDLRRLLSQHENVGAVIPVHIFGMPCQILEINEIVSAFSKKSGRKIPVIYDSAHAFGSVYRGERIGNFGDAEVFSLSATKILTTIEGGLIASSNKDFIEEICKMRNYGMAPYSYNASTTGLNGKMSEFHACIGLENLKRLQDILKIRREKAKYFWQQIEAKTSFQCLHHPTHVFPNFKYFTVLLPKELQERRRRVIDFLKEQGVETRTYFYPPIHQQEYFMRFSSRRLPKTETISRRVLTLPFFTSITKDEMDYIVSLLLEAERI